MAATRERGRSREP